MKKIYATIVMSLLLTPSLFSQQSYIIYEYDTICSNCQYSWHGLTIDDGGVYYDSLLTASGGDSVYILSVFILPSFELILNGSICQGDSFYWMGSTYCNSGTYQINYTSQYGCDSTYILNLTVKPTPHIELGDDITTYLGNIVTLDAGIHEKYTWSTGGTTQFENIIMDGLTPISVSVSVQVTDNLCSDVDYITINFVSPTSIESSIEQEISIYPNPSNGQYSINYYEDYNYKVYDISGNIIIENSASGNSQINLTDYENGMYFLEIETDSSKESIKLIKR